MPYSFVDEVVSVPRTGNQCSDRALIAAAKEGDERAFETLMKRYQARMLTVALRYTRVREDAEDVVQQTFLKAFIYLQRFEGKSALSTWLTRITINEALMLLRRNRGLREVPIDDSTGYNESKHCFRIPDAGPEISYLRHEDRELLTAAVERLRPTLRSVVKFQLRELSARETAQHMGLSVTAVKARVFHGRKQLRKELCHYMRTFTARCVGIASQRASE